MSKENLFSLPAYFICFLLISPFVFFCFRLESLSWPQGFSFFFVFLATLFQAGVSTVLSLFFALLGSRGLLSIAKKKYYLFIEALVLLPCLIPPLLLSLSFVHLIEKIISFPFGLPALIFVQVLSYTGLCTVAFTRILLKETSDLSEWAYLHGSSVWLFFKTLLKSLLLKDIKILFVLVFASSFTSLSLPLLVAGSPFFSLEFFIYEKLKEPDLWPQALSLILFQSFFIFLICWKVFSKNFFSDFRFFHKKIYLLPHSFFSLIPFLAVFFSIAGLFFISDIKVFLKLFLLSPLILKASFNSFLLSLGVGFLTVLSLIFMSLSYQNLKARKFVASFMPPGMSFCGFCPASFSLLWKIFCFNKMDIGIKLTFFSLDLSFSRRKSFRTAEPTSGNRSIFRS